MGILGTIKDAIWGHQANAPATTAPAAAQDAAPAAAAAPAPAAPAAPKRSAEEILAEKAAEKGQDLNWRESIVDLMKVLDLDPSHANRIELAHELGYTGDVDDSATMNVWLHKKVMENLAS